MTDQSLAIEPGLPSYWETTDEAPFAFYDAIHARGGIIWDEAMRSWLVAAHDLVQTVLRDDVTFVHPFLTMKASGAFMKIRSDNPRSSMFLQGEKHRAFHKWWLVELLSPKAVRQYSPEIVEPWIEQLLNDLEGRAGFDITHDFAERLPVGIFAALLDFPDRSRAALDWVKQMNDDLAAFATASNGLKLEGEASAEVQAITDKAIAAGGALNEMLLPLVRARSDGKGSDFISRLWAGGPRIFEDWNERDTLDACRRLLFAGVDTTTHLISNAFYMLLSDPVLLDQVRNGGDEMISRMVEEALRLNGSIHFRPRRATSAVTLGDQQVAEGDMLTVLLIAANRDPSQSACPHAVDMERKRPHDHLAFNYGPRTCLGAHLARSELATALKAVLKRYPRIRLDRDKPEPSFAGFLMRSYQPVHVRVD